MQRALRGSPWLMALAAVQTAAAGSFSVSPIRIELSAAHPVQSLTVHNDEATPVLIQLRVAGWTQPDGQDQYVDTREILSTPPVFEVPANGTQIVRVALRRAADDANELPYRLFLQEVPRPRQQQQPGLTIALRLSLPVFVAATHPGKPHLEWRAAQAPDGSLRITARNDGPLHVQVSDFSIRTGSGAGPLHVGESRYVLPGAQVDWRVTLPAGTTPAAPITVEAASDQGSITAQIAAVDH